MQTNYQVWYRPQGSTTYTPWSGNGYVQLFTSEASANEWIKKAKNAFTNEFVVFQCMEMEGETNEA